MSAAIYTAVAFSMGSLALSIICAFVFVDDSYDLGKRVDRLERKLARKDGSLIGISEELSRLCEDLCSFIRKNDSVLTRRDKGSLMAVIDLIGNCSRRLREQADAEGK